MTEERKTGREAQLSNIRAAVNVAETVRSTLGPAGMDKCLVNETGDTIITNDGVTILRELDAVHPGAKMMVEASKTQEAECKDGTTSVVVLAGQLLALSEGLLMRGIHPRTIVRAFNEACAIALDNLPEGDSEIDPHDVARTALRGKAAESHLEKASSLCQEVVYSVRGDLDNIRVLSQSGGSIDDSYIHSGLVLSKGFSTDVEHDTEGRILMLDGGLDGFNMQDVQMQFTDPTQIQAIQQQELTMLSAAAQRIVDLGVGILFVRDGVHEAIVKYLSSQKIAVVSRLQDSDMTALSHITGHPVYHRLIDVTDAYQNTEHKSVVDSQRIGDLDYVTVSVPSSTVVTLVVRGATRQTLDEYERAFDDAIGVTALYHNNMAALPGGGASLSKSAIGVRNYATGESGLSARERMCLEAYADSLEIIPAAIAANAGMDPLDVVMELRSCPDSYGLYIDDNGIGSVCDTGERAIWEPRELVKQVITSATEVATAVLRIDDIIARKGQ